MSDEEIAESTTEEVADHSGDSSASVNQTPAIENDAESTQEEVAESPEKEEVNDKRWEHQQSERQKAENRVSELEKELESAKVPDERYNDLSDQDIAVARRFKKLAQDNPDDYNRIVEEADPSLTQDGQALREMLGSMIDEKVKPLEEKTEYDRQYREADRKFADDKKTLSAAGYDYNNSKNEPVNEILRDAVMSGSYESMTEAWNERKSTLQRIVPQRSPQKTQAQKELNGQIGTSAGSTHIPEGDRAATASNAGAARAAAYTAFSRHIAKEDE